MVHVYLLLQVVDLLNIGLLLSHLIFILIIFLPCSLELRDVPDVEVPLFLAILVLILLLAAFSDELPLQHEDLPQFKAEGAHTEHGTQEKEDANHYLKGGSYANIIEFSHYKNSLHSRVIYMTDLKCDGIWQRWLPVHA